MPGPHYTVTRINAVLLGLASVTLLLTILVAVANMLLRPLGHPITGSFEIMGYGSAVVTALALGFSQERKSHIAVNILFKHFSPCWRKWLSMAGLFVSTVFFGAVAARLFVFALDLKKNGELSETLMLPFYPVAFIVSFGLFILSLNLFHDILTLFRGGIKE